MMEVNSNQRNRPMIVGIVGSGTAGLLTALLVRRAFPSAAIVVISSSQIGIIGVGEGSTEHWRQFMDLCEIPTEELLVNTAGTHKYGIRYENWTTHTPDYFHSVSEPDDIFAFGLFSTYMGFIEQGKLLTNQTGSIGLVKDKINRKSLHRSTNQFHFDTFKLNEYLTTVCFNRSIMFIDAKIENVNLHEDGRIASVNTDTNDLVEADFWFDASGFSRVLMNSMGDQEWNSYSDYLLCNTAIAFPTESDPNGKIRPYTRAKAASSGWMWEIPTQERRGNGYVFSDKFIDVEQAIEEAEKISGYKLPKDPKVISFDAGYLKNPWQKNCCAVGLASSFVEPLEATSIGSTIQQIRSLMPYLASYTPESVHMQKHYNKSVDKMMRNILTMIRLHYYSDRRDSEFWKAMADMPINSELQELIDLWSERPPSRYDFESNSGQMFLSPHMTHVGQGQGIISKEACTIALDNMNIRQQVNYQMDEIKHGRHNHELVDHAQALREIVEIDNYYGI